VRIVVASGKGGTGKTLVATSLALVASDSHPVSLLDADVEAPNAALFVRPELEGSRSVDMLVPRVDPSRCIHCGRCAEVCQYSAIASLPTQTLVFPELCHGCGGCFRACPSGAIEEVSRSVGVIEAGERPLRFAQGILEIGEAMATPVIRALKRYAQELGWEDHGALIVDAPPGTSCPTVESMRGADVALLVTEPTPFGLHDLRLAVAVARDALHLPVGVVINKDGQGAEDVDAYTDAEALPVLMRIPLERRIAHAYAEGVTLVEAFPEYRPAFEDLANALDRLGRGEAL
jgi:MinD superfamily P-loop ATPase